MTSPDLDHPIRRTPNTMQSTSSHRFPQHASGPARRRHRLPWLVSIAAVAALLAAPAAHAGVVGWGSSSQLGLDEQAYESVVAPTPLVGVDDATAAAIDEESSFVLTPRGVFGAGNGVIGAPSRGYDAPYTLIPGTAGATAVADGGDGTLIVQADGSVLGFGENAYGAAGGTPGEFTPTPQPINGLTGIIAVAASQVGNSYALKDDGTVWAWGAAAYLGNAEAAAGSNTGTPVQVTLPVTPQNPAIAIAAGGQHALALLKDGSVWGWGYNESGQVGDGSTTNVTVPVQVIPPAAPGEPYVKSISAGSQSSFALYSDGTFKAWGYDGYGQLGLGGGGVDEHTPTSPVASAVQAHPDRYPPLTQISAGVSATLAIAQSYNGTPGRVLGWGNGALLGFGSGTPVLDFPFPYPSGPPPGSEEGQYAEDATEIPQQVGRLKGVPWLSIGPGSSGAIASTVATILPANTRNLPFFSHVVGTVSAPGEFAIRSFGETTTVTSIKIIGAAADDFTLQNLPALPTTIPAEGYLSIRVRFDPSALGDRLATLEIQGDGETSDFSLSGYGTELPGNTPGASGTNGTDGARGPAGPTGPAGTNGKNGVVVFASTANTTSVKPGHLATLRFAVGNGTTGEFPATILSASVPKGLHISGEKSALVASLAAGKSRTVRLRLKVGKKAKRGNYRVKVTWKLGSRTVTRTVQVRVL